MKNDLFEKELEQLKNLTAEGGFVVRTFFFLILGYSIVPRALIDPDALIVSALFVALIITWRWLTLRITFRGRSNPLLWIAPRGLITILLYLNIPEDLRLLGFREGITHYSLHILQILPERPESSAFEIGQIIVVGEGFTLETDVPVSSIPVAVLNPTDAVFNDVPQVKRQNTQFSLLA